MTLNEKLCLIADLEAENLSESMIDNVLHMEEHPEEWVGPFKSPADVISFLEDDNN